MEGKWSSSEVAMHITNKLIFCGNLSYLSARRKVITIRGIIKPKKQICMKANFKAGKTT